MLAEYTPPTAIVINSARSGGIGSMVERETKGQDFFCANNLLKSILQPSPSLCWKRFSNPPSIHRFA